jgi:hypothetical protein
MSKHQSIYFKPPDTSLTPSPCDVFYIKGSRSYAVVSFLPEWRLCYFIDIDVIQKQFGIKNSITKEECDAICEWKDYL